MSQSRLGLNAKMMPLGRLRSNTASAVMMPIWVNLVASFYVYLRREYD
ncbi:hypothetical protein IJH97_00920 [Candidatus Saccharibacteria bacterium]|nr:hypothetical protein [Candidatus Saccharibacteria bacterium]